MKPLLGLLFLYLNALQQSWGNPLQQPTTPEIFPEASTLLTELSGGENNGVRLINQVLPSQYQIFTQSQQLPALLSAQGIIGSVRGKNQQFLQVPSGLVGGTYSYPTGVFQHLGSAGITSGSSQFGVSMQPNLQQSLKQGGMAETVLLPGTENLLQATKYGNIVLRNPMTGSIYSGAVTGQHSILEDGSLLQSSTKPDSSILNTVFSGTNSAGGQHVTYPYLVQNPQNIGNVAIPGSVVPNFGNFVTMYSPNILPQPLGANILHTSGTTAAEGAVVPANNVGTILPNPVLQAQTIQVPCTLQIPSPVPISINPGVSQITTNIPTNNQGLVIPSSFIDNSPPTISILRPPTIETVIDSDYAALPVVAAPTPLKSTFIREANRSNILDDAKSPSSFATSTKVQQTNDNARSQDSPGVLVQNNEDELSESVLKSASDLARHGIPMVYTMLPSSPSYFPGVSPVVVPQRTSTTNGSKNDKKSSTSQPTRGNNPFFNVNKRKHFEFYQYF